jgi:hypothetical protein
MNLKQRFDDMRWLVGMPKAVIHLHLEQTAGNDPFYRQLTTDFYEMVRRRHPRFPLIRAWQYGVALCCLKGTPYVKQVESSAGRNMRKAERAGYSFQKIDFNEWIDDIREIRRSAEFRQGRIPEEYLEGTVERCSNPPSNTGTHDYVYYGVLYQGHLVAYGGCFIGGELAMIEHMLGHAAHLNAGVVPMLLIKMAEAICCDYPGVSYYGYGTFFGAGQTMRRFKKKFNFMPHRVEWVLTS